MNRETIVLEHSGHYAQVEDDELFAWLVDPCWEATWRSAWERRKYLSKADLKELRAMRRSRRELELERRAASR